MATGADTKVENGNASAVAYTAYPPPPAPREKPTTTGADGGLPPAQAEMHKKVLGHFQSESYKLPGVEEEDGELREEEKFWLVRFFFILPSFSFFFWLMIGSCSCFFFFLVVQ